MTTAAAPPRGPGRPSTGVRVDIRIPAEALEVIDRDAEERGITRAAMIRSIIGGYAAVHEFD